MTIINPKSRFEFTGGNACLDFANTVNNRAGDQPEELLNTYMDLAKWALEAGIITDRTYDQLHHLAEEMPGRAQTALRNGVHLREAIYAIFSAVTERRVIPGAAMTVLNSALQEASKHARLAYTQRRFQWEWISPGEDLSAILWPVAKAAGELLVSEDISLIRVCASHDCAWLFLDKTKNHRRRWCEMRTCGNRDKARRYYARKKSS